MDRIFISIYQYLTKRRYIIWPTILLLVLGAGISLYYTDLEEDIMKVMPSDRTTEKFNEGFMESELSNRIVFHIYFHEDDTLTKPEMLTSFCESFIDSFKMEDVSAWVKSITYKIDESSIHSMGQIITNNLPIFLKEKDYEAISNDIESEEVHNRIYSIYKSLLTPASFVYKDALLRDPMGFSNLVFRELTNFQLDDNFELYNGFILTKDKRHLLFYISPSISAQESTQIGLLIHVLESIGQKLKKERYSNLQIEYFGGPVVNIANASRIKKDIAITVAVALFSLLLLIFYFFRNIRIFFYILLPVIAGASLSLIIITKLITNLSIISIGVGSVLIGITIDFSIHLLTHYKKKGNVGIVLRDVGAPIIISSITTASAFLCLLIVRSQALHDLGVFASLSVVCVAIMSLTLLPVFFKRVVSTREPEKPNLIDRLAAYPLDENSVVVFLFLILTIFCSFFAFNTSFETDLNKVNYMPDNLRQAESHIGEISDASRRGIYLVSLGHNSDEVLSNSQEIMTDLENMKKRGEIQSFSSPNQLLSSSAEQQRRIDRWNAFWTDAKKDKLKSDIMEASEKLKFRAKAFSPFFKLLDQEFTLASVKDLSLISSELLKDYIKEDENSATTITMIRLDPEQKHFVHERFGQHEQIAIIDKEYIVHRFVDILRADFNWLVGISLLVVFFILLLAYGRFELAIVAFLPISFAWIITLGLMNLLGIKFNIVNVIITSFIFGLGIDYSIFVMRGLRQKYAYGRSNLTSYKTSVILSSATTIIGIGALIFAQHPALKSIAFVSIIGILAVLACSFIIEPRIFKWLTYKADRLRPFPLTIFNIGKSLWIYAALLIGCIALTLMAIFLSLAFFLPGETKKLAFHYMIYLFSKIFIKVSFLNKITYINTPNEKFIKPALIIANHKSLIDTPLIFQLSPKLIIITNDWVNEFPLYKGICKAADFYSISNGVDVLLEQLKDRILNGYSIAIFPEGTRSPDEGLLRFKKGAFYMAEALGLDIIPVLIHGTSSFLKKGQFWGRANPITLEIKSRVSCDNLDYGEGYSLRTKYFSRWYKKEYKWLAQRVENSDYHRYRLVPNFIYKGPVVEWYMRIKTSVEGNYRIFDELIPKNAYIIDLGCGYGFMSYMLSLQSTNRVILGIDYDEEKIALARHCQLKSDRIQFESADIMKFPLKPCDTFILADVLHYLKKEDQYILLHRCLSYLLDHGSIIIRDGDAQKTKRHRGTKLTEIFSTNLGFNKSHHPLTYISGDELLIWAKDNNLNLRIVDSTKFTSNVIFVLEKSVRRSE